MANGLQQRLLAQKLMRENSDNPFSDSRFFSGKIKPPVEELSDDESSSNKNAIILFTLLEEEFEDHKEKTIIGIKILL